MRLLRIEMPVGASVGVAQHFEHGKRTAQQRIVAGRRPDHDELSRAPRPRRSPAPPAPARCSRPTADGSRSLPPRRRSASRQYTAAKFVADYLPDAVQLDAAAAVLCRRAYVLALVLQLNPRCRCDPARLAPLVATVGLFYAVHLTVIFYVLLVVRQLLARELFSPAWLSVGVLTWLCAMAAAAGATLMWRNLCDVRAGARCRHRDGAAGEHDRAVGGRDRCASCWRSCAAGRRRRARSGRCVVRW